MSDIKTSLHYDEVEDRLTVKREQEVKPLIERNKVLAEAPPYVEGLGYYAGSIPAIVIEGYCNENNVTFQDFMSDPKHINRILNDPDYKKFRIWQGKV